MYNVQSTMYNVHVQYQKKCDKIPGRDKRNIDNNICQLLWLFIIANMWTLSLTLRLLNESHPLRR